MRSDLLDEFEVQGPNGTHTCYAVTIGCMQSKRRLFQLSFSLGSCSSFNDLSIDELYKKYGKPETVPITRCNGEPLPVNVPAKAVVIAPLFLGEPSGKLTLPEALLPLGDFGEAFAPATEVRLGRDCHAPPALWAPEAKFEPNAPLSYSSDIWSLATAIWDIIGMKSIFSSEFVIEDEVACQHIDVLGPMPSNWWTHWEGRGQSFL